MITIEEIIIRGLYHKLVLVRIRRSSSQSTSEASSSTNDGDDQASSSTDTGDKSKGLGFLYLGSSRNESQSELSSPRNVFVDTIRLEKSPLSLTEPTLRPREEEVFLTSQIGRIIEIGELHLTTRKVKSSTEVQTDFEPIWCFKNSGSPIKNFGSKESLINLENCNEISLVRLESLGQSEQRSLLVVNSKPEMKAINNDCKNVSTEFLNEKKEGSCSKVYNTKLTKSKSSDELLGKVTRIPALKSEQAEPSGLNKGLVGSYRIFNVTNREDTMLVSEDTDKEVNFNSSEIVSDDKQIKNHELGGIGDVLKPTSFVKFVINRVDSDSYTPSSDIPIDFIPASVDYSEIKFKENKDEVIDGASPKIKPIGSYFRERRRSSQKRSRSLRRIHGGIVDREKLLKHIMACGAHDSRCSSVGFKSPQDVITITDFKVSPFHCFNSSQNDLRTQNLEEFSNDTGRESYSMRYDRKTRSERSSPLMMTSGHFREDDNLTSFTSNESNSKHSNIKGIPCDTLWNASFGFPISSTINSFPDDISLSTFDSSTLASSFDFEKFPDWMRDLPYRLKARPLSQIRIPGSHISLAIDKDMKMNMDFSKCNYEMAEFLRRLPNLPVFNSFRHQMKHIWRAWMPKQFLSVYDQLVAGSRYLDMRVTKHSNILFGEHGLYTGQLKRYLKEVRLFLEEHIQEVVVIHLQLSDFVEASDKKHLVTLLFQVFGSKLACWDKEMHGEKLKLSFPSVDRLLRNGKQAIAFMPADDVHDYARNHIFGGSVWPDSLVDVAAPKKQTLEELRTFLNDCYSMLVKERDCSRINVLRAVLSPDMSMVFGRYDKRKSMRELSFIDTSPLLSDWLLADGGKRLLNIVALDFVGSPGVVKSVLELNDKDEIRH